MVGVTVATKLELRPDRVRRMISVEQYNRIYILDIVHVKIIWRRSTKKKSSLDHKISNMKISIYSVSTLFSCVLFE